MGKRLEHAARSVIGTRSGDQRTLTPRPKSKVRNGLSRHRIGVCKEIGEFVSFVLASDV